MKVQNTGLYFAKRISCYASLPKEKSLMVHFKSLSLSSMKAIYIDKACRLAYTDAYCLYFKTPRLTFNQSETLTKPKPKHHIGLARKERELGLQEKLELQVRHITNKKCSKLQYKNENFEANTVKHVEYLPEKLSCSIGKYIKLVSPSSDDIQIEYLGTRCLDETAVIESLDIKLFDSEAQVGENVTSALFKTCCANLGKNLVTGSLAEVTHRDSVNHSVSSNPLSSIDCTSVVYCSPPDTLNSVTKEPKNLGRPSEEQLSKAFLLLKEDLPELFAKSLNHKIYSTDIIFENRIQGTRSVGITAYIRQASILRLVGHIKYAFIKFEILKITQHPDDSTIRVRWRITGVSAFKSLSNLFTLKTLSLRAAREKVDDWHDGFSIFHVGQDGLIFKHVADKMMPDEELLIEKNQPLATRLAALIGVTPSKVVTRTEPAVTSSSFIDATNRKDNYCDESIIPIFLGKNIENTM